MNDLEGRSFLIEKGTGTTVIGYSAIRIGCRRFAVQAIPL
jgi:hypothetical protein